MTTIVATIVVRSHFHRCAVSCATAARWACLEGRRHPFSSGFCGSRSTKAAAAAAVSHGGRCFFSTSTRVSARVGWIGLGNMGYPMAINLAKNNHQVLVYDVNASACERAAAQEPAGISMAANLETMAQEATRDDDPLSVIFTMLPSLAAVDAVLQTLANEILNAKTPPKRLDLILVDCSTVSPATSQKWHKTFAAAAPAKIPFLDAPVSGGVKGAQAGTLTFMVGGSPKSNSSNTNAKEPTPLDRVQPLLLAMGQQVFDCGEASGAGTVTKLCNNLALATQMIGICEALNLADATGLVDPVTLSHVMNVSTAKCWSSLVNNPHPDVAKHMEQQQQGTTTTSAGPPAARDYAGGFATNLMLKDLTLATEAAQQVGTAVPLTALSKELYQMTKNAGMGAQDFGVMYQFLKGSVKRNEK